MIDCSDEAIEIFWQSAYEEVEGTWYEYLFGASWGRHRSEKEHLEKTYFALFGFPVFFGAIHVAAWNNTLPSQVEVWMWRSSSLFCSAISLLCMACMQLSPIPDSFSERRGDLIVNISLFIMISLYVVVRIYMIFEVFFSIRALPRSAYGTVSWSAAVPHI